MEVAPDFDEFIACLTAHGVEFVVVGAYALAFHGAPRFTGDLDILIRPTSDNAARLTPAGVADERRMIEMGVPPVQIHVMSAISGVAWPEIWTRHVEGPFGSRTVPYIGRETLIRNKRAAARPKDLSDIDALERGDADP
jgi:hypothetical protein